MNIIELQSHLIKKFPEIKIILSNILTAEVSGNNVVFKLPNHYRVKQEFKKIYSPIKNEILSELFPMKIDFIFQTFKMPIFPYTIQNSKYKNYIFFVFPENDTFFSCIIRKNEILGNNRGKINVINLTETDFAMPDKDIFDYIFKTLNNFLPHLKEVWSYLQTIFPYKNYEDMMKLENLYESVITELKLTDPYADRFIGKCFFTFIDYKDYIKNLIKENEKL